MFGNRSLALKLILLFSLSSTLIFSAVFVYNYRYSREIILRNQEKDARNLALVAVNRIEALLNAVEKIPENLAVFLEKSPSGKEDLLRLQKTLVKNNAEIFGCSVAFEPEAVTKNKILGFAPYFYKKGSKIEFVQLNQAAYAYPEADWYLIPKTLNTPQWSEPYYDEGGGNILMTTYSVPFFQEKGGERRFRGIIGVDISLERLQEIVSSIKILKTGYGFLISQNGTVVTHPSKELIMNGTIFGLAEDLGDKKLREIGRKMIRGESGFTPFLDPIFSRECSLYYVPIPSSGWSLAVLFPLDELMADIQRLNRIMIIMAIIGLAGFSVAVIFISRTITGDR
ncbi:MAG: serine/threonine protein phosphatase, partial [Desulfobacca sp.]|nr:serine/threonine protein phosphatase [Desulfobacca sp.]